LKPKNTGSDFGPDLERALCNVLLCKCDIDDVVAWLAGDIDTLPNIWLVWQFAHLAPLF
jgi:hypothetical protein